jgi:hypothetical protein
MAKEEKSLRKPVQLIILVAVIALMVVGYFLIKNRPKEAPETGSLSERVSLSEINAVDMIRMELHQKDGNTVVFEKEGENWKLRPEPVFPVDSNKIKNIERSFTGMTANRTIDEHPESLKAYGLDEPLARATAHVKDGDELTFLLGNKTPTGNNYYLMKEGDPAVYASPSYVAGRFLLTPSNLRVTTIASFDNESFAYMKVNTYEGETIEIVEAEKDDESVLNTLGRFKMVQPYTNPRGIHSENFGKLLETIPQTLSAKEFIEDDPKDLSPYGLNPPQAELILRDKNGFLKILAGSKKDKDSIYAALPDKKTVFTLRSSQMKMLSVDPFEIADKFVLLVNIDFVESVTFKHSQENKKFIASIEREETGEKDNQGKPVLEETYFLNGDEIEEDPFKEFYQKIIGLIVDAENPDTGKSYTGEPLYEIEYTLNRKPWTARVRFYDYDRDFCVVVYRGSDQFLIARDQLKEAVSLGGEILSGDWEKD